MYWQNQELTGLSITTMRNSSNREGQTTRSSFNMEGPRKKTHAEKTTKQIDRRRDKVETIDSAPTMSTTAAQGYRSRILRNGITVYELGGRYYYYDSTNAWVMYTGPMD